MKYRPVALSESGITLIELLVAIALLSIAMTGVTSMVIMSLRTQGEVNADFRSQLDVRQSLYDMEKEVAEAKRSDSFGNQPIFQANGFSVPTQDGDWVTYQYSPPLGGDSATILKITTISKPAYVPITYAEGAKQMVNVGSGELTTTVESIDSTTPIFSYFDDSGSELVSPVTNPRSVRSIKVAFKVTVSDGHAQNESTISTTKINLRNY